MRQVNNSATFHKKPTGFEEFPNQMVETLCITIIDRCPKGRPRKRECKTIFVICHLTFTEGEFEKC